MKNLALTLCLCSLLPCSAHAQSCVPLALTRISEEFYPVPQKHLTAADWARELKTSNDSGTKFYNIVPAVLTLRPDIQLKVVYHPDFKDPGSGPLSDLKMMCQMLPRGQEDITCGVAYLWFGYLPKSILEKYHAVTGNTPVHCCIVAFKPNHDLTLYLEGENGKIAEETLPAGAFGTQTLSVLSIEALAL